ncbi:hypothetical protein DUI87_16915 [Hirundo rustica rustica]|uniref:Uncharacterized protein n=1 Tax=Hirundo rustica rustica TaxID=333673 RepID=A0A3M0K2G3_HIRRU|nr:hypothetical protein DUI87_16915 [Hirundo rustica rustica]
MEVHEDAEIHLQPMEKTHSGADGCLRGYCEPVEDPWWSRLLAGTCVPMERGAYAGAGVKEGNNLRVSHCAAKKPRERGQRENQKVMLAKW